VRSQKEPREDARRWFCRRGTSHVHWQRRRPLDAVTRDGRRLRPGSRDPGAGHPAQVDWAVSPAALRADWPCRPVRLAPGRFLLSPAAT